MEEKDPRLVPAVEQVRPVVLGLLRVLLPPEESADQSVEGGAAQELAPLGS